MDYRLFFSATKRNRNPIREILTKNLPEKGTVLEIASGSGEHAVFFQKCFPGNVWQSSDPDHSHRRSIHSWINYEGLLEKMPLPIDLDVEKDPWPLPISILDNLCAIVCINMLHVAPWSATQSLFNGALNTLKGNSPLIIYGPFKNNGQHISQSNEVFDKSLKEINSSWGLKNLQDVNQLAEEFHIGINKIIEMPANNLVLIYTKL